MPKPGSTVSILSVSSRVNRFTSRTGVAMPTRPASVRLRTAEVHGMFFFLTMDGAQQPVIEIAADRRAFDQAGDDRIDELIHGTFLSEVSATVMTFT